MTRFPLSRRALPTALLLALTAGALTACGEGDTASATASAPASAAGSAQADGSTRYMIDNGGHDLAFYVTPGRLPAIVLDSGGGEDHTEWKDIAPKLHAATGSEVITYDRAGMGASDEVPGAWNVRNAVSDLRTGLRELGVTKDVVLVAHSQAGEIATYLVRANPALVSGAVLVDASLPQFYTDAEITRLVALTKPQVDAAEADPSTKENRQLVATAESFVPTHTAYHKVTWPDSVPATVMLSEKTPFDGSPEDVQRWRAATAAFAEAGPHRTLITATGSSHEIPADRPGFVIAAIEKMVAARTHE